MSESRPVGRPPGVKENWWMLRLPERFRDKIQAIATAENRPLAWTARQLIDEALERRKSR